LLPRVIVSPCLIGAGAQHHRLFRAVISSNVAAAPIMLGWGTVTSGLVQPPSAGADPAVVAAAEAPGQAANIISRAQWGADESIRSRAPMYDNGIKAGIVHHTAGVNDYAQQDSAAIVRSIYAYHTHTLGWSDIAYNALVDKYGQVFEGRFGGMTRPVQAPTLAGSTADHRLSRHRGQDSPRHRERLRPLRQPRRVANHPRPPERG
jgi:hypothetical protein